MDSAFPQWIQDINTGLSLIGFFITLYVLVEVKYIKNSFLRRARLPEISKELSKAGSVINKNLDSWPAQCNEVRCQIKVAASLMKSASRMLPNEEKEDIARVCDKLIHATSNFDQEPYTQVDKMWDLYTDIQYVITRMNELSKNIRWE